MLTTSLHAICKTTLFILKIALRIATWHQLVVFLCAALWFSKTRIGAADFIQSTFGRVDKNFTNSVCPARKYPIQECILIISIPSQ
jgi:hypothetical protein